MPLTLQPACQFAVAPIGKTIRALVAYEGTFVSGGGASRTFTPKLLQSIADASNEHLTSGVQAPVFYSDHEYSSRNKIGLILGPYVALTITEADLPNPNLTDLVGKVGLFTQVELIKEDAIADYNAKLLKPISMGVDFAGRNYQKNAVFEISCVGFGAIPGAQLFSKGGGMEVDFKEMAQRALTLQETFGLTLAEQAKEDQLIPNLYRLFEAFTTVIRNIESEDDDEIDKEALTSQAISDLTVGLASRLRTSAPISPQMYALDPEDPEDPEEEDMSKFNDLQQEFEQFKLRTQVQTLYHTVSTKANELFSKCLITPAQLKEFEAPSIEPDSLIETFSASSKTPESAIAALNKKMIQLETIEQFGRPIVQFGSKLGNEPLGQEQETEVEEFLSTYSIRSPLYPNPLSVGIKQ